MTIHMLIATALAAAMALAALGTAVQAGQAAQITDGGKTRWRVYVPAGAGEVERFAASELRRYVELMAGARLGTAPDQKPPHTISIGLRKHLDAGKLPEPSPGADGYVLTISPEQIIIAGDNERGALYGVYDLLERMGCRWFVPAIDPKDPEVVPKQATITLGSGQWAEAAPIKDRILWASSLAFTIRPEAAIAQLDWAAKNRYNGLSWQCVPEKIDSDLEQMERDGILREMARRGMFMHGPGHSFPYFLPTERYFDDHPEWFGYQDGKRHPHGGQWPLMNFCMSNADARKMFIENVAAFAKKNPQIQRLDILPIDGAIACECEECSISTPTDLLVGLLNELSVRLEREAPEIILDSVPGYGLLEKVPKAAELNGKWAGMYAHWGRNHHTSYDDADYARRPSMLVWQSYYPHFSICSYYAANSHQPFNGPPFLHALRGDAKYMVEHGVAGHLVLEYPFGLWWNNAFNVRLGGLHSYYYPERTPEAELKDFALGYYGEKAGPLLAEFYHMLGSTQNLERTYRASRGEADEWDRVWLEEMRSMIRRAASLAEEDAVHAYRVSKLDAAFDMLQRMGDSRLKVNAAVEAAEKLKSGEGSAAEVRNLISEARLQAEDVLKQALEQAAREDGTMDGEWIKGWTIERTLLNPLNEAEKDL